MTLLVLLSAGCGAVAGTAPSQGHSRPSQTPLTTASTLADLRTRPFNLPALAAGGTCPATSFHDLNPVVSSGPKGKGPGFGFGPGPTYLSGITQLYPGGFDNEVWLVDPSYVGPTLVRGRPMNGAGVTSFQEPTSGPGFSNGGSPPPSKPVATVTIEGSSIPFYDELDLPAATSADATGYWRMFFARTHIDAPGCYALQLDGLSFSLVIVVQVPDAARPGG
jgi:hypothetical protein